MNAYKGDEQQEAERVTRVAVLARLSGTIDRIRTLEAQRRGIEAEIPYLKRSLPDRDRCMACNRMGGRDVLTDTSVEGWTPRKWEPCTVCGNITAREWNEYLERGSFTP